MVAEEYRMGGTCVIRGCVPKKLFVLGSHVRQEIEDAAGFGWTIRDASFDWPTLIANKDKEIARLEAPTPPMSRSQARRWSRPARCWRTRTRCALPTARRSGEAMC